MMMPFIKEVRRLQQIGCRLLHGLGRLRAHVHVCETWLWDLVSKTRAH